MHRLLHLSDIHFGRNHAFAQNGRPPTARSFCQAVLLALQENNVSLGFSRLIISGDVFSYRELEERTESRLQLAKLAEGAMAEGILMVPGNHDFDWGASLGERLFDYELLVDELGAAGMPVDLPTVDVVERVGIKPLAVLALDSCKLESESQSGLGLVGAQQLDTLAERVRDANVLPETHTIVAVLHHHLLPVGTIPVLPPTLDPAASDRLQVSVTVDATNVMGRLAELGTAVVLHGHHHVAAVMQFGQLRWRRPLMHVASAGSAGISRAEVRRQFFIWELQDDRADVISLRQREDDPARFERDADNSGALKLK